jgi:hypothetical protein
VLVHFVGFHCERRGPQILAAAWVFLVGDHPRSPSAVQRLGNRSVFMVELLREGSATHARATDQESVNFHRLRARGPERPATRRGIRLCFALPACRVLGGCP